MWWNEVANLFTEHAIKVWVAIFAGLSWIGRQFQKWVKKKKEEEAAILNRITDLETEVRDMGQEVTNLSDSFEEEKTYRREQDREVREMFGQINEKLIHLTSETSRNSGRLAGRLDDR